MPQLNGDFVAQQLPYVDEELYREIVDTLQDVSKACMVLSQQKGDTPSYFVQFFGHLVRNSSSQRTIVSLLIIPRTQYLIPSY